MKFKSHYYYIGIFLLLLGIFFFFYQSESPKKCDKNSTKSILFLEKPVYINITYSDNLYLNVFINNTNKKYIASSIVKNFFKNVSPLCSDAIYKFNPEYFKNSVCFKAETYEICRGEKLQKGYPVVIKKQETFSNVMYIIDSYPWERIETTLQQMKSSYPNEPLFMDQLIKLIDKRIITLPERSFISNVVFQFNAENFHLQQIKKNQWQFNGKEVPPNIASSLINAILMLEEEVTFNDIPDKNQMDLILDMNLTLDFEELKFSLFQNKSYKLKFYQFFQKGEHNYYFDSHQNIKQIKKEKFLSLEENIKTLIKTLKEKKD